ncbi:MAG: penicillin-binding protein 1A, partial [Peptococcaceae bacterium]|nr:penicillin-binding protein 1A [Peptococcaceae bacterium]
MTENKRSESSSKKKAKTRYKIHWFRILLAVFVVCAIIGCGVVAGVVFSVAKDTPDLNSIDLDSYSVTTTILDKDDNPVGNLHAGENRVPVDFDEISPNAVNALVAIEDQRFYTHNGVDPIRIGGAMIANIKAGGIVQGGSTITQQLTGLVFLDRTEKSYTRKLKEAILSMEVEKEYSKDEIITHYLNRAYFGGGAYGIEAAAEYFFAKHASELTVPEAAMLAGCIQNPSKWSPIGFPENALKRRNLVLDQMAECEFITKEEAEQYKATEIQLSEVRVTAKENNGATPYQSFINHVIEEALVALELEDNDKALYTGGYIIHTTMDPAVQRRMEEVFNNDANFPNASIQAAMVVTDPETGEVRGIMGGRHQEAARELNRATQSFRQPGSSFKPIAVYAPAFEAGYGPGTVVDDYPKDYSGHVFQNSNRTYSGLTTIRKGIVSSLNVVAVKTMEMTGIDECYKFAKKLGFSKMTDNDRNLSTALGGLTTGVSPLELAGAYGTFA